MPTADQVAAMDEMSDQVSSYTVRHHTALVQDQTDGEVMELVRINPDGSMVCRDLFRGNEWTMEKGRMRPL